MSSLYSLTNQYLKLTHKLGAADFDAETIADTIDSTGITDELSMKAQGIEFVARSAEAHHPAIDAEIARLQALKAHRRNIAAGPRAYLMAHMQRLELDPIA